MVGLFFVGLNVGYDNQDFVWSDMLNPTGRQYVCKFSVFLAEARATGTDEAAKALSDRLKDQTLSWGLP